jgi:hydroxymethylglutaryl-CoA reductase (NADPH)
MTYSTEKQTDYPEPLRSGGTVLQQGGGLYEQVSKANIENYVGTARIPVGIAGPVQVHGDEAQGEFYIPMATTEGTLVASASRGMKVINESGGVRARVVSNGGIQRAPVFEFHNIDDAADFTKAINDDWSWLVPIMESTTSHGKVMDIRCWQLARMVCMRFTMNSGDASGQNMVSIATAKAITALMERHPKIRRHLMAGGMSGEKVGSNMNALLGRGKNVVVSVDIPGEIMQRITRADIADIPRIHRSYTDFALLAGNHNSHHSHNNVLPAIYIAAGQDPATLCESSYAQNSFDLDSEKNMLRWDVHLPNVNVGTVGGGTGLPTQRECLDIMDCHGVGKVNKFAELCAVACLANEISFWGSVCAQEWVNAHADLRKK